MKLSRFSFETDTESEEFCLLIAAKMVASFGISHEEAIGRINRTWEGLRVVGDDIIYHETREFWAYDIYYGHDAYWWNRKNDPTLEPIPYP